MKSAERQAPDLRGRIGLSMAEAAAALGVSERHLRSFRRELPVAQLGGKLIIPVDSLRDWVRRLAEQGTSRTDAAVVEILKSLD